MPPDPSAKPGAPRSAPPGGAAGRYVVALVAGIGNALMAVPMVRQLRAGVPKESSVHILAMGNGQAEPFRRMRGIDVMVTGRGALPVLRGIRSLAPVDVLMIPFPSNRWQYNVLAMRSGAKRVLLHGYPDAPQAWLSSRSGERVPARRGLHDVAQNLLLLDRLGLPTDPTEAPKFPVTRDDEAAAADMLRQAGVDERKPYVVIHAGSALTVLAKPKRWPVSQYAALANRLSERTGWPMVVVEGPDEAGVSREIVLRAAGGTGKVVSVPLRGSLGATAAVMALARLYVGTDSGLAHLASAVGTRAVTLFAPADPERVCPFGYRDLVIQPVGKACVPCFLYPWKATKPKLLCRPPYCIEGITVEQVLERSLAALGQATPTPAPA